MPARRFGLVPLIFALAPLTGCGRDLVRDPVSDEDVAAAQTSGSDSSPSGSGTIAVAQAGSGGDGAGPSATSGGGGGADGVGGAGGEGGSGVVEGPHTIEIDVRARAAGADIDDILVIVSDVDGSLRHQLEPDQLPAEVEVVDGDLVSIVRPNSTWIESYRVTPQVTRIERVIESYPYVEGAPMDVTVVVPDVDGASHYVVEMEKGPYAFDLGPGPYTFQIDDGYYDPQYVMVRAMNGSTIVAYDVFELAYGPGTSRTITPVMHTERVSFTVDVTSLGGATSVYASAYWWLRALNDGGGTGAELDDPPASWSFTGSVIAPGLDGGRKLSVGVEFPAIDGRCPSAELLEQSMAGGDFAFDAAALRAPAFAGDLFMLEGPGTLGDHLWRIFTYEDGSGFDEMHWFLEEDPTRPALPAVFPDLGPDAPLQMIPVEGSIVASRISNRDTGRGSYAAHVARDGNVGDYTIRSRSLGPCR